MRLVAIALILLPIAMASPARAEPNNPCDEPGEYPDVIVADIASRTKWGTVDGITAFSLGVTACNPGSCWVNWQHSTANHPGLGQNMFRLASGRFEQIGQSWLFHEFFAFSSAYCSSSCIAADGGHLGVNCSNTGAGNYSGSQQRLGPKSEANPWTGIFPFPATDMNLSGDVIFKRLQVHNDDLDPARHAGAQYWVEVQFVARDDAAAGNLHNNVSFRPINIIGSGTFDIALTGSTFVARPAIDAWKLVDPNVAITDAPVSGDGRFIVGSRVTATPTGYHYEYAVQNLDSHRSAATFTVPLPAGAEVTNIGFHDADYHSGDLISGVDWTATISGDAIVWATEPYAANPNANALRWGTLYNFRFDSPVPPFDQQAVIGMFRPGVPAQIAVNAAVPCHGSDVDADSNWSSCDCDDGNAQAWAVPSEVSALVVADGTVLSWNAPASPGASAITYDVLRSSDPSDFTAATCLPTGTDPEDPAPGGLFAYLVRARNACPDGEGSLGESSAGAVRSGISCP